MTKSYVKVVVEDEIACYINTDHFAAFFEEYTERPSQMVMIRFAECAINIEKNTIIKCRNTLESVFDGGFARPIVTMYFKDVK